ncbi:MAG: hypothetical protein HWD82_02790 [Flavobacteriaceae bacterium]|nr:hypothetical protein [Flavobacteriaceae bacterium]
MKYRQLTKEQFEALHKEFATFLATQSIDSKEWNDIKQNKPKVAEEELNIFSDLVWDDVLTKTKYLEHYSKTHLNIFKCKEDVLERIFIKVTSDINLLKEDGFNWLMKNPQDNAVEIYKGSKAFQEERNIELFKLIEQGAIISKGEIFEYFKKITS